jgi:hypothetical protein
MNNIIEFKSTIFGNDPYWKNVIPKVNASQNRNMNNYSYGSSPNSYNTTSNGNFIYTGGNSIQHDRTQYISNGVYSCSGIGL